MPGTGRCWVCGQVGQDILYSGRQGGERLWFWSRFCTQFLVARFWSAVHSRRLQSWRDVVASRQVEQDKSVYFGVQRWVPSPAGFS
ncbi:hypothetical protein AALO_G00130610 [Alosa alosa]|uniref:Uncharacterized protein n=1 Tax=Alosa alosa TaxID=278164 RepID=A0AAV6GM90_9TELE|nr:hypothetical protein AALO_G00130610 [Alosa alosa]